MVLGTTRRRAITLGASLLVFSVVFGFTASGRAPWSHAPLAGYLRADTYVPRHSGSQPNQLVLLYFGSAACAWSNQPHANRRLDRAKRLLQARADSLGLDFLAIGVAIDRDVAKGLSHLNRMAPFDEVAAGAGWSNAYALMYFGANARVALATPQLMVAFRRVEGAAGDDLTIATGRILLRRTGAMAIDNWVAAGAPVPGLGALARLRMPDETSPSGVRR